MGSFNTAVKKTKSVITENDSALILEVFLTQDLATPVLDGTPVVSPDTYTIDLLPGHGFSGVPGDEQYIEIFEEVPALHTVFWQQAKVLSLPSTNTIEINQPVEYPYSVAARVRRTTSKMNVNGATTSQHFTFSPPQLTEFYFETTRAMVSMSHATAGDLDKFGGIAALARGVVFGGRILGVFRTLFVAWKNEEFKLSAYDVDFVTRSGGQGSFGTTVRRSWGGNDKNATGVAVLGEGISEIEAIVRDNISTLGSLFIKVQGKLKKLSELVQ